MFLVSWKRKVTANVAALSLEGVMTAASYVSAKPKTPRARRALLYQSRTILPYLRRWTKALSRVLLLPARVSKVPSKAETEQPFGVTRGVRAATAAYNSRLLNEQWLLCRREYSLLEGG